MLGHRAYLDLQLYRREWIRPRDRKGHMRYLEPGPDRRNRIVEGAKK